MQKEGLVALAPGGSVSDRLPQPFVYHGSLPEPT